MVHLYLLRKKWGIFFWGGVTSRKECDPQATWPKPVSVLFLCWYYRIFLVSFYQLLAWPDRNMLPHFFSTATIVPFVLFFSVVLAKCLEQAKSVVVGRNTVSTMKANILKKKFSSILRNENHTIIKPYCQPHCQFTNLHYGPEMKNSRLNWMATLYQQKPWVTTYVNLVRKYF